MRTFIRAWLKKRRAKREADRQYPAGLIIAHRSDVPIPSGWEYVCVHSKNVILIRKV